MKQLLPEYKKELADLKTKMLEAQEFAEKFPVWQDMILSRKLTRSFTGKITDKHKEIRLDWGVNRWFYRERENITNYKGVLEPQYLWNIYINQINLFGNPYQDTCLCDIPKNVDLFFFDSLNNTFYATDDQIIPLLDALSEWYVGARAVNDEARKEAKKADLLKQLERLG